MYLCNIRAPLIHDSGMIKHASQLISGEYGKIGMSSSAGMNDQDQLFKFPISQVK